VIAVAIWQDLLYGLGWLLARIFDLVPSYALAIIILTVLIRLILLPLGIKQIRSMQAMGALQPKMKQIQQKYKGNRAKQQEEIQKLYQEHGVNPFGSCLPMLLQLPVLIALYSVLRFPTNVGAYPEGATPPLPQSHIPTNSQLYDNILNQQGDVRFLLCSAGQAGTQVKLTDTHGKPLINPQTKKPIESLDCGKGIGVRIPYYLLALLMVGTTYFQQRQMQKANPVGSQQQQALTRIMPLLFGVWGFLFPAGLVVYWTTSNLWQIGQQHFMIRAKAKEEEAIAAGKVPKRQATAKRAGLFAGLMARAQQQREQKERDSQPRSKLKSGQSGSGSDSSTSKARPKPPAGRSSGNGGTKRSGNAGRTRSASGDGRAGGRSSTPR